jgi:hypothetical protein
MSRARSFAPALTVATALILLGTAAAAQTVAAQAPTADSLFREGRAAMKANAFATACPKFAESYRLDPAAGTLLNLATCEQRLGKLATAALHYRQAAEAFPAGDERIDFANRSAAALDPKIPRLVLTPPEAGLPYGAKVRLDNMLVAEPSLGHPLAVDPGEHVVTVEVPGRPASTARVPAKEGETSRVILGSDPVASPSVPTQPATGAPPAGPAPLSTAPPARSDSNPRRALGYTGLAVGGLGLGLGAFAGIVALDARSTMSRGCDDVTRICKDTESRDAVDRFNLYAPVSVVALSVGALATGAGVYFLITGAASQTAFTLTPNGVRASFAF